MYIETISLRGLPEGDQLESTVGPGLIYVSAASSHAQWMKEIIASVLSAREFDEPFLTVGVEKYTGCKLMLGFRHPSGQQYRVERDFRSGGFSLEEQSNSAPDGHVQWSIVANTTRDVNQALRVRLGMPSQDAFETLYMFSTENTPTLTALESDLSLVETNRTEGQNAENKFSSSPGESLMESQDEPQLDSLSGESLSSSQIDASVAEVSLEQNRLRENQIRLEQAIEKADERGALEDELEQLEESVSFAYQNLGPLKKEADKLQSLKQQAEALRYLEKIPSDFQFRMQSHEALMGKHEREIEDLEEHLLGTEERAAPSASLDSEKARLGGERHLWKSIRSEPSLIWGVGLGLFLMVVAIVGASYVEHLRFIAWANLILFSIALRGGFRLIGRIEHDDAEQAGRAHQTKRLETLRHKAALDKEAFFSYLASFQVDPGELADISGQLRQKAETADAIVQLEERQRTTAPKMLEMEEKLTREKGRLATITKQLKEMKHLPSRVQLEYDLQMLRTGGLAAGSGPSRKFSDSEKRDPNPGGQKLKSSDSEAGALSKSISQLLSAAQAVWVTESADEIVAQNLKDMNTTLRRMGSQTFCFTRIDARTGEVFGCDPQNQTQEIDGATLSPASQCLLFFAIKMTLVLKALGVMTAPIYIDDSITACFSRNSDKGFRIEAKAVHDEIIRLADATQVWLRTSEADLYMNIGQEIF
jgi:hypothetical protein